MLKTKLSAVAFSVTLMATTLVASQSVMAEQKVDTKFINDSSYAIGTLMGKKIEQIVESQKEMLVYNQDEILAGVKDTLKKTSKLKEKELEAHLDALDKYLSEKEAKIVEAHNKEVLEAGKKFREDYAKKDGVKTAKSGLMYKIEKQGKGKSPKIEDTVKVHYEGTLTDGTVFDSSYKRGEAIEFQLSQLIPAWKEAIPMLKKGGKMELVVPAELGYGANQVGNIPANSTLIFKIELLDFQPTKTKK
ncbi:FKBP-type peptidyl-prolyl cis-trans isomerase [Pasteurella atlantica]|uniref:FKBP-type peptidyl-prolyl cis-trans isomerase n=1 Tax=Pasteurellaceae TaxID=712 RepID=UPI00274AB00C|nr:FKBP-type peptidyl-prolyl cis-trans isomerase [Pasteurella atlantica]MDP8033759.1 FKBP-type peptidyl-prolyl cis-trans isomerase [Pasteurella atlantica]MDP8035694.1 FKBP-type peptidyl-prolyl cis-trans isomerase [Pasteurella atlantica]MDP8037625.1 FKBP-type peptidyl-prolyl cis-trans isomerase [Pasteurella atlantica]MDP8047994.1 FKBP-type peptidyl-prolyl cis-trans isomerase [Pasteurella atlantica]MDP8049949.1 FKBP-type peptidyl-prolyl cis-trans isomerase [Pasteurella atlantica]